MYLTDYHSHSLCSPDSTAPLADMVAAAAAAGLRELCTTDHFDLLDLDGRASVPLQWGPILDQYQQALTLCPPTLKLRLGLELGYGQLDPAHCQTLLSQAPLDYVIGSIHNTRPALGGTDLSVLDFRGPDHAADVLQCYLEDLLALAPLPIYDCLGHIIYPLRYTPDLSLDILTTRFRDLLATVLECVIAQDRGIEVNTNRGRDVQCWAPILSLYRDLGGELVTVGCDAHVPEHVGLGVAAAQQLLLQTGFRYLTTYQQRTPRFIKL